jgi:hypothetical protein
VASKTVPRFVLDQNFPHSPILSISLPDIEFVALRAIHPDLTAAHADWQVFQQLSARKGIAGFVTTDAKLLRREKEMVVLSQTRLSLVVLEELDNDPLAASALLVAVAGKLARALDRRHAQVFRVRLPRTAVEKPSSLLKEIESHTGRAVQVMQREQKLTLPELRTDCRQPDRTFR